MTAPRDPVTLSAVVLGHRARPSRAAELADRLGGDVTVVYEAAPAAGSPAPRRSYPAWQRVAPGATHHLVVQDDVEVPPGFLAHAAAAAARHPRHALAFFAEWGSVTATAVRLAALRGDAWAPVLDRYAQTEALLLPAAAAREAAGALAALPPAVTDDFALRDLLARRDVPALVSVPNLVQHADPAAEPGHPFAATKRAASYTPGLAAPGVPDGPVLPAPVGLPHFSWWDLGTELLVWDDPGAPTWRRFPLSDFFSAAGLSVATLRGSAAAACRQLAGEVKAPLPAPPAALYGGWLTGYALGLFAAGGGGGPAPERLLRPASVEALRTLIPGALRALVTPAALSGWFDPLAAFVTGAVRAGAGTATAGALPTRYLRALSPDRGMRVGAGE